MPQLPKMFQVFVNGPFNSRFQVEYTILSSHYEALRRTVYRLLQQQSIEGCSFVIESYRDDSGGLEGWLNEEKIQNSELIFSKPQGVTRRDSSLITADLHGSVEPYEESFAEIAEYFAELPRLEGIRFFFRENGIGVFCGTVCVDLVKEVSVEGQEYQNFMRVLRDAFATSPQLAESLQRIDTAVADAASRYLKDVKHTGVLDLAQLYPQEPMATPLWGHGVSLIVDQEIRSQGLPYAEQTRNLLIVSHPDGLIDMNKRSRSFIHLGWGMSLGVNVTDAERAELEATLGQLQFYWRSAQIYNDKVMDYMERYANMKAFSLKKIKQTMGEIEQLKIEAELFFANQLDYIRMLSPFSHFLFSETSKSWRINEMLDFFTDKMDSLSVLHEQGETRLKENLEDKRTQMSNRLNVLLSILALLTLFSWAADSMGFLDETLGLIPSLRSLIIGGKFMIIALTPILVLGIFFLFFRIIKEMKKVEEQ